MEILNIDIYKYSYIAEYIQNTPIWQQIAAITLLAAFSILLLDKWKVLDYAQRKMPWPFYKLAQCDLCLSFWASVIISTIFVFITGDWSKMLYPLLTAPLTRILL